MSGHGQTDLDARAWLLWGVAASLPPLLGRNPFVLTATLLAVLGVRAAMAPSDAPGALAWNGIVRLAAVFASVGALFNVLTAHLGDRPFASVPDSLPIIGGPLTLNALVYGLLSGSALLTLVLVGTTLGAALDWPALARLLPARLSTVAVAGAVAWAFIPQTVVALREIREAQAARGYRARGGRDLVPLLVPLLAGGLERAVTLAEALESRGFSSSSDQQDRTSGGPPWRAVLAALGLAGTLVGAYLLAAETPIAALTTIGFSAFALAVAGADKRNPRRRTRYRHAQWRERDSVVAGTAIIVVAAVVITLAADPRAIRYDPYPSLIPPRVNLGLLAALTLLLSPVLVAPVRPSGSPSAKTSRSAQRVLLP